MKPSNRKLRLGTGTILGIVAALAVGAYSARQQPAASARYLEADASGKFREVSRAPNPSAPAALIKPEPAMLLQIAGIGLSSEQKRKIQEIERQWEFRKANLLAALDRATPRLDRQTSLQMSTFRADFGEFSALSREYNRAREAAYQQGLAELDARQTLMVRKEMGR